MRRPLSFIFVLVLSLVLAACGGSDDPDAGDDGGSGTNGEEVPSDGDGGTSGDGTVTVVIDGTTHEFSGANCSANGNIFLDFSDGDDAGSITASGDINLIRLDVEGVEYVDMGSAHAPDDTGSGFSWSGEMSGSDGETVDVEITYNC
jgi:hypothetical protein